MMARHFRSAESVATSEPEQAGSFAAEHLAYSATDDRSGGQLDPEQLWQVPSDAVSTITQEHDFSSMIAKFQELKGTAGLSNDPTTSLRIWESALEKYSGKLSDDDKQHNQEVILDELGKMRGNLAVSATLPALYAASEAFELLDDSHKDAAVSTFRDVLNVGQLDPVTRHAAEEVLESYTENPESAPEFNAVFDHTSSLLAEKALSEAIKRKQRRELFKKVITGKIFLKKHRRQLSKEEIDQKMAHERQNSIESTGNFQAAEKLSLDDLLTMGDDDTDDEQAIDAMIARDLSQAKNHDIPPKQ